jgi:hypothetical protein
LAAAAGFSIVSIRPWREPIKGLAKNHRFVIPSRGRVMAPIVFWVPNSGTGAVQIGFSKNSALILMGDWCGSIYRSVTNAVKISGAKWNA